MLKKLLVVAAASLTGSMAMAACSYDLHSNDAMRYVDAKGAQVKEIVVPASCDEFTINLKHIGKIAKSAMGHNIVIVKSTDVKAVAAAGKAAGVAGDYLPKGDARVIAASKLIGGGESTSVKFPVAKVTAGGFDFFCTFPGHEVMMHGQLTVK